MNKELEQAAKTHSVGLAITAPDYQRLKDSFIAGAEWKKEQDKELVEALRSLVESEWMVTHDWGGDRKSILDHANSILSKYPKKEKP